MVILGIDPGTATVGYGVIKLAKTKTKKSQPARALDFGVIKTALKKSQPLRLRQIYRQCLKLLAEWRPDVVVIENVYFFKNSATAMAVAQAQGVIMMAAAAKKIEVQEVTPLQVKMAIAGYGQADKKQVQKMIQKLLHLKELPKPDDAADALGAALCCSRPAVTRVKPL